MAQTPPLPGRHVFIELVSSRAAIAPGERFTVALRQQIRPGWHTYWRNPGDSGIATTVTWALPAGYIAGPLQWPAPKVLSEAHLVTYGYEGEALLPIELTAPNEAAGEAHLRAHVLALVCADVCVPEESDVALDIPLAREGRDNPAWSGPIAAARAALPRTADFNVRIETDGKGWRLIADGGVLAPLLAQGAIRRPTFLPYAGDVIDHPAPQRPRMDRNALALMLAPKDARAAGPLRGVLEFERRQNGVWKPQAAEVKAEIAAAPMPAAAQPGLAAALAFAFLGGIILNLMPCVFPVLSMKALHLAGAADERAARRTGAFFAAGAVASFLVLAGALIALQAGGSAIGWGFQLQEPLIVAALALLFFAIGLNLIGVFEIGGLAAAAGSGKLGAFSTGALAVIAATPCTAPFMAAALGYAATQSPPAALAVFAALGVGFAAPFFALSTAPALRALLPKPGPWMEKLKQFLAFPMFAASIWLVWVLARQTGANGVLAVLGAFLALVFGIWAKRALRAPAARWAAIAAAALALVAAGGALRRAPPVQAKLSQHERWSLAREEALRAQGAPVFVNFTAAWCLTCQVNEQIALSAPQVGAAFARRGVTYLVADWTRRDGEIAAALRAHGRDGVPLYLYYPRGAARSAPQVLPQILTPRIVVAAVKGQ